MFLSRKAFGLEIYQDGAFMVLTEGKAHAPKLNSFQQVAFTPDTVKNSLREENIKKTDTFVAKIREGYLKLLAGTNKVSVSLPDASGRVLLLDLETRFKTRDEGVDIIRWKLKKNFPFDVNEMHLDYQILREKDSGEVSTLVSLISRKVVVQYEDLLIEAGLQPNRIDFTTFNIYRLFSGRLEMSENAALMIWHGGTVSILIFHNGVLDFYRSKELPGGISGMERIFREISSSLLVYKEKQPGFVMNEVFFLSPDDQVDAFRAVVGEATGLEPVFLDSSRICTGNEGFGVDSATLNSLSPAMGASVRNL